jgi:hypothetical protein
MITIAQPAMALNAEKNTGPDYKMWNSWKVATDTEAGHILGWTRCVADSAPGGKLKAVVFNSHGDTAYIGIGRGIWFQELHLFSQLAGKVDEIYIVACSVVSFTGPNRYGKPDGNLFCSAMAKLSGAKVYASNAPQHPPLFGDIAFGKIDGFEGQVWCWSPVDGSNTLTDL